MKEITNKDDIQLDLKQKPKEEEKANVQIPDSNYENPNNYDEEEFNLDIINKNMENENNFNDFDKKLIEGPKDENNNKDDNNNEYLFEKIKDKLREEKTENKNNNDIKSNENIEINEDEEKISDIYDLPLSINIIENQINSVRSKEGEILSNNSIPKKDETTDKKEEVHENNNENNNNVEKEEKQISIQNNQEENMQKINNIADKIETNINKNNNNVEDLNNINKDILNISPIINSKRTLNSADNDNVPLEIPEGAQFGINETGNPVNIAQFLEDKNKKNSKNKIIAFIIPKDDKTNYLKDIKGNILQKNEDDYYLYKDGIECVIIKDFDIQHPELRVYGHRKIDLNEIKDENNQEKNEQVDDKKENENANIQIIKEKINISKDNNEKDSQNTSVKLNFDNFIDKKKYFRNDDISEITINNNNKNRSVIIKENKIKSNKQINNSFYTIKSTRNNNFDEQMNIWRQRYGKNSVFDESSNIFRNCSNNLSPEEKIINRTDSILKMNVIKKNNYKIPINKNYNYMNNGKTFIRKNYLFKDYKNSLIKRQNNSFSKNLDNPLLNESYKKNENVFPSIIIDNNNKNNAHKIQRNKSFQYINIKYNNFNKDFNSLNKLNINYSNQREELLQNIRQKYKNKLKPSLSNFNIINNSYNYNTNNNINIHNEEIKKNTINNYIYNNLRKINEIKCIKKNLNRKCSVLSNEASKIIKDFNIKQKQKERQKVIKIENTNYTNYFQRELNQNIRKNNFYTFINQKKEKIPYFGYENEKQMSNYNYDNMKLKIIPNKININKFEMLNNNNFNTERHIKERNINNFYRKIKHNTSNNNYNNF